MNTPDPATPSRAVVIGAGIGGLTAAGALAGHFDQVIVLERDPLPAAAGSRAGTPQARHVHGLLAGGLKAMAELFPGIEQDLLRAGALPFNGSLEVRFERPGFDPYPARDLGVLTFAASRPLLEFVLRARVERLPTVRLQSPCRVRSILCTADGSSATGVCVEDADSRTRDLQRGVEREQQRSAIPDGRRRGEIAAQSRTVANQRRGKQREPLARHGISVDDRDLWS